MAARIGLSYIGKSRFAKTVKCVVCGQYVPQNEGAWLVDGTANWVCDDCAKKLGEESE